MEDNHKVQVGGVNGWAMYVEIPKDLDDPILEKQRIDRIRQEILTVLADKFDPEPCKHEGICACTSAEAGTLNPDKFTI